MNHFCSIFTLSSICLTLFQLKITAKHSGRPACETAAAVPPQSLCGVLNMIDLAGSESLTSSDPVRIAETQHINKSLGSIADVIGAISSKQVRAFPNVATLL
jgi:hypothetical protein